MQKRWMTIGIVFLAGLGLGALVVGQGFLAGMRRVTDPPIPPRVRGGQGEVSVEEGFRDPLITLVKPTAAYRPETPLSPSVRETDPVWGSRAAAVRIVAFGDMTDPATHEVLQAAQEVWETHQDTVQLVWKDFPLPLNAGARDAAVAARCAHTQGRFWKFIEEVTSYPAAEPSVRYGAGKLQETNIVEVARLLDLDQDQFQSCLSSPEPIALVNQGLEEAQALDLDAVPTVFVGPYRLTGAVTREAVERLIAAELKR